MPGGVAVVAADGTIRDATRAFVERCGTGIVGQRLHDVCGGAVADGEITLRLPSGSAQARVHPVPGGARLIAVEPDGIAPADEAPQPPDPVYVRVLGRCRIEGPGDHTQAGRWLEQRPGQLLRLLVAGRTRVLSVDDIGDALWPEAPAASTVRYTVHALRDRLEQAGATGRGAGIVLSHRGGYRLNPDRVTVDADVFEREVRDGLAAFAADGTALATRLLERAVARYAGEFLEEEPYAEWVASERERHREHLRLALEALATLSQRRGDLGRAAAHWARLADLEPLDAEVHRNVIELCLRRGRHGEARRRYDGLARRLHDAYGEGPSFALESLSGARPS